MSSTEAVSQPKQTTPKASNTRRCLRCGDAFETPSSLYYFEGAYYCPEKCRAIQIAEDREKTRIERGVLWKDICPPLYQTSDESRLPKLKEVMGWIPGPEGLLLHGPTGKGKTRCAWMMLRKQYVDNRYSVKAFDSVSFSHEVSKYFNGEHDAEAWVERQIGVDIMFFDDLGKCRLTERGEAELFGLIEGRMAKMMPMIITTNFVGDSLSGNLRDDIGKALIRRLRECCRAIGF